jgi:hypothetical protein
VECKELVHITLNGLSSSWYPFVQGVYAHERLPTSKKFWDDFMHDKTKVGVVSSIVKET